MNFNDAITLISDLMECLDINIDSDKYDGIAVKKLASSNTLGEKSGNQTHIAITGPQMDMFPYLCADGYFTNDNTKQNNELKKYFVAQIPITLNKKNLVYLESDKVTLNAIFGEHSTTSVLTSVYRSRRKNSTDQMQMSLIDSDDKNFIKFRKLLLTNSYLIMLKKKNKLEYDFFGVKPTFNSDLYELNNNFYLASKEITLINVSELQTHKLKEDQSIDDNIEKGANILLYGVPGSGKSHTIKTEYCNDPSRMERVVFHPDYTYSDFTGQILPKTSSTGGKISYQFTPGPFTKILKKAVENPSIVYYLIIEELNRGNAPSILGDVLQLLDREDTGESSYGITNSDIANEVYGTPDKLVVLPSNLNILATMNTSDQNIFTLDTAFQRRWDMRIIKNDIEGAIHYSDNILDTNITWGVFVNNINNLILDYNLELTSSEDKRLGAYFIEPHDLEFDPNEYDEAINEKLIKRAKHQNSKFPEKILKFLWDDAFKFNRDAIFKPKYRSLESLIMDFKTLRSSERFSVFNDDIF